MVQQGEGWSSRGRGVQQGERGLAGGGGRGHFIQPATYCTTTWCFALKGLCTMIVSLDSPDMSIGDLSATEDCFFTLKCRTPGVCGPIQAIKTSFTCNLIRLSRGTFSYLESKLHPLPHRYPVVWISRYPGAWIFIRDVE